MARKKPAKPAADPVGSVPPKSGKAAKPKKQGNVLAVTVSGARGLHTVEPDHYSWKDGPDLRADPIEPGAIVRLRPPATATDAEVERSRKAFEEAGAARVTVLPRPRAELLPEKAAGAPQKAVGAREAVLSLVEESSSKDKGALRALCEKVMAEVGL